MNTLAHPSWPNRHAPALGFGVSLLVHALAVAWLLHAWLPARQADDAPAPPRPIEVRLAPPRAPEPAAPVREPDTSSAAAGAAAPRAAARSPSSRSSSRPSSSPSSNTQARPAAPRAIIRSRAAADGDARSDDASAAPSSATGPAAPASAADADAAPAVDMAAARNAARLIGREGGKGLIALPARKPVVDPNADHQTVDPIEAARRKDCTTAYSGLGLLALIPLAKDAITGTGCKW